jgi:hypothetical protein
MNIKSLFFGSIFLCASIFVLPMISLASTTSGTIDSTNRYAWSENVGWIDFGSSGGAVTVTDSGFSGYAYGENIGWIVLSSVTNNAEGTLSGYAWSENTGWIDFSHVTISSGGIFGGYAYGENIGNIIFNDTTAKVTTDWRPASSRTTPTPTPTTSSSSGGGSRISPQALAALFAPSASTTAYLNSLKNQVPGCPPNVICTPIPGFVPNNQRSIINPTITPTTFTRNLTFASQGVDVKTLQSYLNTHGFIISTTGGGSPGNETAFFGNLTKQALIKFQKANNISPPVGFFGPLTRAFITNHP